MPVITISRKYGSGGSFVAARIREKLGWDLLDNNLVDSVAQRLNVTRREVESREERVPSLVQRLADAMALGTPEMPTPISDEVLPPSEERLLEVTRRVISEAVSRGPVILVGRGAQAQLADRSDAIHVFCYAPLGALAQRAAERHGISLEEAEKMVHDTNRQRALYVKKHFHRDWTDFSNYHLCLNTEWLGIEACGDMVARLAQEKFGSTRG